MSQKTSIEWTATRNEDGTVTPGHTWNPVRGCTKVSEGCKNCYAMSIAYRFSGPGLPYEGLARKVGGKAEWTNIVRTAPDKLDEPLHWKEPSLIFVNSMSDLFHPDVPVSFIAAVFGVMALGCHHTYQILTKRPERMAQIVKTLNLDKCLDAAVDYCVPLTSAQSVAINAALPDGSPFKFEGDGALWPLPNVWLGTSIEDQKTANERIPHLLKVPAAVRFLSCEPLLGPVNLNDMSRTIGAAWDEITEEDDMLGPPLGGIPGIDWVIVGGESGSGARPMHPDWVRSLQDQCVDAGVPFFFKQWGEWSPDPDELYDQTMSYYMRPDGSEDTHGRVEKKRNGDGIPYDPPLMDSVPTYRIGKKAAGRLLDGREWNEMPQVAR